MPPKRKGRRNRHNKPSSSHTPIIPAMSDFKVPQNVIASILIRLPVKSLQRLKLVCKPWRALLSSSNFIAMHRDHTSSNPQNHSLIIHSVDEEEYHNLSLLKINSTEKPPVNLLNPFPVIFLQMDLVGSINGLVCLSCPPLARVIILWNPALNQSKAIRLPNLELGQDLERISLGFGYDLVNDDYKVVRIACLEPIGKSPKQFIRSGVEVYSAKLDSWKRIELNFPFKVAATRNNAIVNGGPYWTAIISESKTECKFLEVLIWYDVQNEQFKHVPMPEFARHEGTSARFVECNGSLASLVHSPSKELSDYIDVFVYDEIEASWKKKSTHGPIAMKMERHIQCSKDGVILAETPEGKLFLYDPATNDIKEFIIPEAQKTSYEAFSYAESLVYINGMERVQEQDKNNLGFQPEALYEEDLSAMSLLNLA